MAEAEIDPSLVCFGTPRLDHYTTMAIANVPITFIVLTASSFKWN